MGLSFVGYIIGILIGFFIGGAIGGILLALSIRDRRDLLVFSSAVGFGIGGFLGIVVASAFFVGAEGFIINGAILGVFGGASLGAGMYLAEKQTINQK